MKFRLKKAVCKLANSCPACKSVWRGSKTSDWACVKSANPHVSGMTQRGNPANKSDLPPPGRNKDPRAGMGPPTSFTVASHVRRARRRRRRAARSGAREPGARSPHRQRARRAPDHRLHPVHLLRRRGLLRSQHNSNLDLWRCVARCNDRASPLTRGTVNCDALAVRNNLAQARKADAHRSPRASKLQGRVATAPQHSSVRLSARLDCTSADAAQGSWASIRRSTASSSHTRARTLKTCARSRRSAFRHAQPARRLPIATDGDFFLVPLNATLFPGAPAGVEVHMGFREAQEKYVGASPYSIHCSFLL